MNNFIIKICCVLAGLLFLLPVTTQAASLSNLTKIENIRAYTGGDDQVRIVVDAAGPVKYNSFVLSNPGRIAIDIKGAWLGPSVPKVTNINSDLVGKVRISQFDKETVRVVVEANVSKEKYKIFALGANKEANKSYRIVMDFGNLDQANGTVKAQVDDTLKKNNTAEFPTPKEIKFFDKPGLQGKVIAIDPGHGGSDPGAIGPTGLKEKEVTLNVGLKLKKLLEAEGATVIMTRTTDIDVARPNASAKEELQARVDIANKANADVFVSIHMDSFVNGSVGGTSTYIYPKTTGDLRLGSFIREGLLERLGTDDRNTKNCNFYVVKFTKMPATLAEVAFISNSTEEKMLRSSAGTDKAAQGFLSGLQNYFSNAK